MNVSVEVTVVVASLVGALAAIDWVRAKVEEYPSGIPTRAVIFYGLQVAGAFFVAWVSLRQDPSFSAAVAYAVIAGSVIAASGLLGYRAAYRSLRKIDAWVSAHWFGIAPRSESSGSDEDSPN